MFVIRQPTEADVSSILDIANHLDTVNLPARRDHIQHIVEVAIQSFDGVLPPLEREYLFVLCNEESGDIVGTSIIHAQHGFKRAPHVFFHVRHEERYSETLDRFFRHQYLKLGYDYDGPTELAGLVLSPKYRRHELRLGTALSYVRFLFIAAHREWFRDDIICELLPPLEPDGSSKLWDHLGKRFTGLTYKEADFISKENKEFIRALFPQERIYTALFPEEVKQLIGEVGEQTRGVKKLLERIGFRYANQIDPFDGGPHFHARTDEITLVQLTETFEVNAVPRLGSDSRWALLASMKPTFRAIGTAASLIDESTLAVPEETLRARDFENGDTACALVLS